jgi:hypothetical protein
MKNFSKHAVFAFLACAVTLGCSAGDVPSGMSGSDAKAAIDRMSPEQKIKAIASSPMPGPEKEKEYAKIEAETGVKAADVLKDQMQSPGAGATAN